MRVWSGVLVSAVLALGGAGGVAGAAPGGEVTVILEPDGSSVVLGGSERLSITVTNTGDEASAPLAVHLDVTDPAESWSVDPEDWTATLTKPVGVLAAGETAVVDWEIQPISPGTFSVYAVVLSTELDTVAASNVMRISVADERSLNPGGILPVAIGAPTVVGALLVVQLRMSRRPAGRRVASSP